MARALPLDILKIKKGDKVFLIPFHNHSWDKMALYPFSLVEDFINKRGLKKVNCQDYRKIVLTVDGVIEVEKESFLLFEEFPETGKGVRPMFRAKFFALLNS